MRVGPTFLAHDALGLISDIQRKETTTAIYFSEFLTPGALKSDDGWLNLKILKNDCVCTNIALNGLVRSCSPCESRFAANRIAEQYQQQMSLNNEVKRLHKKEPLRQRV